MTKQHVWAFGVVLLNALLLVGCAAPVAPTVRAAPTPAAAAPATQTPAPLAEAPTVPCITSPVSTPANRYEDRANPLPTLPSGDIPGSINVAGRSRTFVAHVPQAINCGAEAMPLLVVLHPDEGSAEQMMELTQLNTFAESKAFVVVYANGSGDAPTWNAGACCGYAMDNKVDDVAFIRALIDAMLGSYHADAKRVYVTGLSSGAMMTYRLAIELPDKIGAIAPVNGALVAGQRQLAEPVSVLAINGDADTAVRFESAVQSVQFFARADGCAPSPHRQESRQVIQDTFTGCNANSAVVFYTLKNEGHRWPPEITPPAAQNTSTATLIWNFFAAHAKP